MADQERKKMGSEYIAEPEQDIITVRDSGVESYQEETAAEIAAPASSIRLKGTTEGRTAEGRGMGYLALTVSILSLFILPVLFGAAGIILGFIARKRGSGLGSWAIGIGVISILVGVFILPFF